MKSMDQQYTMECEEMNTTETWLNGIRYLNETCPLEGGLRMNDEPWTNDYKTWINMLECTKPMDLNSQIEWTWHECLNKALDHRNP